jgi:hypothetical protein
VICPYGTALSKNCGFCHRIGAQALSLRSHTCTLSPFKNIILLAFQRSVLSQERSLISADSLEMGSQSDLMSASSVKQASAVEGYVPRKHAHSSATPASKENGRPVEEPRVRFADYPGDGNASSAITPPLVSIGWTLTVGRKSSLTMTVIFKIHHRFSEAFATM